MTDIAALREAGFNAAADEIEQLRATVKLFTRQPAITGLGEGENEFDFGNPADFRISPPVFYGG